MTSLSGSESNHYPAAGRYSPFHNRTSGGYAVSRLPVCFYFCLFHLTVNHLSVYIVIRLFA
jgi:hypothetical protein